MSTLEFHRCAVLGVEPLQSLGRAHVESIARPPVRMQYGYATTVGLLEFIQTAIGMQAQGPVHVEKVGFASHVLPFKDGVMPWMVLVGSVPVADVWRG